MTESRPADTHQVLNQPPPLANVSPLDNDRPLQRALALADTDWARPRLVDYSTRVGSDLSAAGRLANKHRPELHSHDNRGFRIGEVEFHPAYHQLMAAAIANGWHTLPWREPRAGAHCARAAGEYLHHHADPSTGCPLTMSFAAYPVLAANPALAGEWLPRLLGRDYAPENRPWYDKSTVTLGMGMTEKQGGSDVRSNTTRAVFTGNTALGPGYEITGHKWFMSAPMSDGFLVLAQAGGGLSCFLMPRWREDGSLNGLYFQRLKNKLGNHANASSEVEFRDAAAWLVGEESRGIATIIDMVALTRFDCMVGSAALMRNALVHAIHHCRHRQVMGKALVDQPLMRQVLADLAVSAEAALHLAMRVGRALDHAATDESEKRLLRLVTPIGKYWNCKIAPGFIYEAMECLGGNGYVEDDVLALLYREAPVNAIWEGSGNVQCLDVLRAIHRDRRCLDTLLAEIETARGDDPAFDHYLATLKRELPAMLGDERGARALCEQLALAMQASLLLRHGLPASADYFCRRHLTGQRLGLFGAFSGDSAFDTIIDYAFPP